MEIINTGYNSVESINLADGYSFPLPMPQDQVRFICKGIEVQVRRIDQVSYSTLAEDKTSGRWYGNSKVIVGKTRLIKQLRAMLQL